MMKKLLFFAIALTVGGGVTSYSQTQDISPVLNETSNTENTNALFDLLYTNDIGSGGSIGADGQAGVIFFDNEYWVSSWATNLIHLLDAGGNFIETFDIPGITGTRSMTTNGTSIFIGTASLQIFEVDPITRTLINTISISTGSDAEARMLTFDETLDGGNGGFWIGDFGSDIASLDMNGVELSVIPFAMHNTVIYGGAIDNVSPGGPFLWIHDQGASQDLISQIDVTAGSSTGLVFDYSTVGSSTAYLAGGLFISDEVVPGFVTLVGLCQCTPSNVIFGLELVESLGVDTNSLSNFTLYPNPAKGIVNIETSISGEKQVVIYDMLGKQVLNTVIEGTEVNISNLSQGVYTVSITQNKQTATKKLVVK